MNHPALNTTPATEAQAERAIAVLKRAIDAAENSNQAGENFVVAAAAGEDLLAALSDAHRALMFYEWYNNPRSGWASEENQSLRGLVDAAIAKATGGVA